MLSGMAKTVDVVVLGLGVGGEAVAGSLAESGLEVVGVESTLVGGECPYWGCIPSKMMVRSAGLLAEARRIPGMAGEASVRPDYGPVAQRIRDEATTNWDDKVAVERLTDKGVSVIRGVGRLTGPGEVSVDDQVFLARRAVVLGTGTKPSIPPISGLDATPYWTNREAIEAKEPPDSLLVIGGGAIGLELAQVFARFGTAVTVVEAAPRILAVEEPEASELLTDVLPHDGITIKAEAEITAVRHDGTQFTASVDGEELTAEALLVSTGRRADLGSLGLDAAGIDGSGRFVEVDDYLRVRDGVWAVGDVTGKGAFTHVATYQAAIASRSILGQDGPGADYAALPRVTFTDPEVGAVGLTEQQARESDVRVRTGMTRIESSTRGWIHKAGNDGFIKLVEDADAGVLIGATSAGPSGGEVLGALAVAVHARVPTASLRQMIYAYPTFHRAIEEALVTLAADR
jgi:pyruvate/2-oxoglutarate dehydrogenase complex dihydrolipoamide dehydrogenase (E3) component